MSAFTAPATDLRVGVDYVAGAQMQDAFDALEWRDGPDAVRLLTAVCSSTATLTTTTTDVTGCSITFTLVGSSSVVLVNGVFAFSTSATGVTIATGSLMVDGVAQAGIATKNGQSFDSQPCNQMWLPTLAAGSHTLKLRAAKTAALGTMTVEITHTVLSILVFDHR